MIKQMMGSAAIALGLGLSAQAAPITDPSDLDSDLDFVPLGISDVDVALGGREDPFDDNSLTTVFTPQLVQLPDNSVRPSIAIEDFDLNSSEADPFLNPNDPLINSLDPDTGQSYATQGLFGIGQPQFVNTPDSNRDLSTAGCGFDGFLSAANLSGSWSTQRGLDTGDAAPPANDGTCYFVSPNTDDGAPSEVEVDFTDLLFGDNVRINYLGLYWGSIDEFNTFQFFEGDELIGEITGGDILDATGGEPGDQLSDDSSAYVNLLFGPNSQFTSFKLTTNSKAFEIDNVAVGFTLIPVPAPLALLGAGLLGLGLARRRRG